MRHNLDTAWLVVSAWFQSSCEAKLKSDSWFLDWSDVSRWLLMSVGGSHLSLLSCRSFHASVPPRLWWLTDLCRGPAPTMPLWLLSRITIQAAVTFTAGTPPRGRVGGAGGTTGVKLNLCCSEWPQFGAGGEMRNGQPLGTDRRAFLCHRCSFRTTEEG